MIKFTAYGEPVPYLRMTQGQVKLMRIPDHKLRPGALKVKNNIRKRLNWKQHIQRCGVWRSPLLDGPLLLGVKVYRSIPKSFSRKRRDMAILEKIWPTTNPDLSNYIKLIEDALNGVIWTDDARVVGYLEGTGKYYGNVPRVEVEIEMLTLEGVCDENKG